MSSSWVDRPADDEPRDVSQPSLHQPRPVRFGPGVIPTPESDTRTHQRFSDEGESLAERERHGDV